MKFFYILIIACVAAVNALGQNAFYDARYLNTISESSLANIEKANTDKTISLSDQESATIQAYKDFIKNPFDEAIITGDLNRMYLGSAIEKYNDYVARDFEIKKMNVMAGVPSNYIAKSTNSSISAFSMIGNVATGGFGLSPEVQTQIIDGLAKYYAEEFKKAQLLTYMQVFKETIGKVGELEVLLPQTYSKLASADPSKFPELGNEYKSIFNDDLRLLLENLMNHIESHTASNSALENKLLWLKAADVTTIRTHKYYGYLKISGDIGSKLINNYHPVDLFNFLDTKYYSQTLLSTSTEPEKIAVIIHGINLLQRNLLDTTKTKESQFSNLWLGLEAFKKLSAPREQTYFAGLIFQQDKVYFKKFIRNFSTTPDATETQTIVRNTFGKIDAMLPLLVEIQDFRSNLKKENVEDNFVGYMNLILKTLEKSNYYASSDLSEQDFKTYLRMANYTLNIYDNVRKKDYNNSIYYTAKAMNELLAQNAGYLERINQIDKYVTFMTDVVNAKNSDDIKECIKKNVAPPTSFILKREYKTTLSVTGQPGYFVSVEKYDGSKEKFKFASGITLPLGFELTFKQKHGTENSGSIGIFAQVIDIGAVLNFRVGDSSSPLPDKIEFQQFFSPGGSVTYGFKNSPLTLGFGYQYTPQLRKLTLENGNEIFPNGHRIFLRLGWDIPLVNILKSKGR